MVPDGRFVAVVCAVSACVCAMSGQSTAPAPPKLLGVTDALSLYDRGSYPQFFDAIARDGAVTRDSFKVFDKDASRWIAATDVPSQPRRTIVAASVAIEIAHRLHDEPPEWPAEYLVWVSRLMRTHSPAVPSPIERLWYLAVIAGTEELDDPWVLTTATRGRGNSTVENQFTDVNAGGQAAIAARRFPDEPRFRLARVEALEADVTWADAAPSFIDLLKASAATRAREEPHTGVWDQAPDLLRLYARIPDIVRAYESLDTDASLQAEVGLHVGFLESAAGNWDAALTRLRRVPALTDEVYLRYLSQYFIGRVYQKMGDHPAAEAAFEQAVRIVPNARSATVMLAAELMMSDRAADRNRAYSLLPSAYTDAAPTDPWRLYPHGDARLWPAYMARLREALR
jgi:tetratricopeptide (TPR) repeat protein